MLNFSRIKTVITVLILLFFSQLSYSLMVEGVDIEEAVKEGKLNEIKKLVQEYPDSLSLIFTKEDKEKEGMTWPAWAVIFAAHFGRENVITYLAEQIEGVLNEQVIMIGETMPLFVGAVIGATLNGRVDMIEYLKTQVEDPLNNTVIIKGKVVKVGVVALAVAANEGRKDMIEYFEKQVEDVLNQIMVHEGITMTVAAAAAMDAICGRRENIIQYLEQQVAGLWDQQVTRDDGTTQSVHQMAIEEAEDNQEMMELLDKRAGSQ